MFLEKPDWLLKVVIYHNFLSLSNIFASRQDKSVLWICSSYSLHFAIYSSHERAQQSVKGASEVPEPPGLSSGNLAVDRREMGIKPLSKFLLLNHIYFI
jgi:hypothetical protein